jgi:hypothetical protein
MPGSDRPLELYLVMIVVPLPDPVDELVHYHLLHAHSHL